MEKACCPEIMDDMMSEFSRVGYLNLPYINQYVLLILLIFPSFKHIQDNLLQVMKASDINVLQTFIWIAIYF